MANLIVRKGNVVKTDDGREGLIVFKKGNHTIGINFNHWHIHKSFEELSETEKRDNIYKLGCNEVFTVEQITEIVRGNEVYSY